MRNATQIRNLMVATANKDHLLAVQQVEAANVRLAWVIYGLKFNLYFTYFYNGLGHPIRTRCGSFRPYSGQTYFTWPDLTQLVEVWPAPKHFKRRV